MQLSTSIHYHDLKNGTDLDPLREIGNAIKRVVAIRIIIQIYKRSG